MAFFCQETGCFCLAHYGFMTSCQRFKLRCEKHKLDNDLDLRTIPSAPSIKVQYFYF